MQQTAIPEGYLKDSQARLVPLDMIKDIDVVRNDLVLEIVEKASEVSLQMPARLDRDQPPGDPRVDQRCLPG